jgi:hypothetical protein
MATWTGTAGAAAEGTAAEGIEAAPTASGFAPVSIRISAAGDDQDNDQIADNVEGAADVDGDNVPNFLDEDSDGDGATDRDEAAENPASPPDGNGNHVPAYLDAAEKPTRPVTTPRLFLPTATGIFWPVP